MLCTQIRPLIQERTLTGQTGLHLAAERDLPEIASVLLDNKIDFSAGTQGVLHINCPISFQIFPKNRHIFYSFFHFLDIIFPRFYSMFLSLSLFLFLTFSMHEDSI